MASSGAAPPLGPIGANMQGITQDEVSKLTKAMKDEKFREYMDEYSRETSDPRYRKEYMDYLSQLEAKGEMPEGQQLLRCQPGLCVKTLISFKTGQTQKCFFNIVHSERLHDMAFDRQDKGGHNVQLPYSLSPPRQERDKKDEVCMVCDMAVSTYTYCQAVQNSRVLKMLVDTASDGLTTKFLQNYEEVKKDFKVMRRMQCKGGYPYPMSVQANLLKDKGRGHEVQVKAGAKDAITPGELKQMRQEAKDKMTQEKESKEAKKQESAARKEAAATAKAAEAAAPRIRIPKHKLIYSGTLDLADYMQSQHQQAPPISTVPRLLKLTVEVPTVKRVGDITLEVTSNNVVIDVPEKYYLDLPLPYEVDENNGTAKFDKAKNTLALELPVVPKAPDPETLQLADKFWNSTDEGGREHDGALSEGGGSSDEEDRRAEQEADALDVAIDTSTEDTARGGRDEAHLRPADGAHQAPAADDEEDEDDVVEQPPASAGQPPDFGPPPRERLELSAPGGEMLHIVQQAERGEEEAEAEAPAQPPPKFTASERFDGARPGCVFKLGDQGLGYYRDSRAPQRPRPKAPARPAGQAPEQAPTALVQVTSSSSSAKPGQKVEVSLPPLPGDLQQYVDATRLCHKRLSGVSASVIAEAAHWNLQWRQTLHNLVLILDASRQEIADVQLSAAGRSLAISFCARLLGGASPWQRHLLRRVLVGPIDPRQWHAEPPSSGGGVCSRSASGARRLTIVLRKVDREPWADAFDATATQILQETVPIPQAASGDDSAPAATQEAAEEGAGGALPPALTAPASGAASAGGSGAPAAAAGAGSPAAPAAGSAGHLAVSALGAIANLEAVEDSAELDAAEPLTHGPEGGDGGDGTGAAEGGGKVLDTSAAASLQQSAMVMGQAVLLKTRLMYQLL